MKALTFRRVVINALAQGWDEWRDGDDQPTFDRIYAWATRRYGAMRAYEMQNEAAFTLGAWGN